MDGTREWDDFDTEAALIAGAATAEELFGAASNEDARVRAARTEYRRLARLCHPDHHTLERRPTATAAFTRLAALWRAWRPAPGAVPGGTPPPVVLTTKRHTWQVGPFIEAGDATNRYEGADADDPSRQVILDIPRRAMDSDFVAHEAGVLTHLERSVGDQWRPYFPDLVESFRHRDADGFERQINVLKPLPGFVSVEAVRAACPDGLDPRDVAWMWRRLLVALGAAHHAGVVHGAVLPDRVMIHPGKHGLVLRAWGHAVLAPGGRVLAVAARYKDWYPPEVLARGPAGPPTDIYLATRTMASLMGERIPRALRAFVEGCTLPAPAMRPADAWDLLAEFDDLIERLWGPRRFRPLHLPTT